MNLILTLSHLKSQLQHSFLLLYYLNLSVTTLTQILMVSSISKYSHCFSCSFYLKFLSQQLSMLIIDHLPFIQSFSKLFSLFKVFQLTLYFAMVQYNQKNLYFKVQLIFTMSMETFDLQFRIKESLRQGQINKYLCSYQM